MQNAKEGSDNPDARQDAGKVLLELAGLRRVPGPDPPGSGEAGFAPFPCPLVESQSQKPSLPPHHIIQVFLPRTSESVAT